MQLKMHASIPNIEAGWTLFPTLSQIRLKHGRQRSDVTQRQDKGQEKLFRYNCLVRTKTKPRSRWSQIWDMLEHWDIHHSGRQCKQIRICKYPCIMSNSRPSVVNIHVSVLIITGACITTEWKPFLIICRMCGFQWVQEWVFFFLTTISNIIRTRHTCALPEIYTW